MLSFKKFMFKLHDVACLCSIAGLDNRYLANPKKEIDMQTTGINPRFWQSMKAYKPLPDWLAGQGALDAANDVAWRAAA